MKLTEAKMCLDCEELFEGEQCPKCANSSWVWVQTWIPSLDTRRASIIGSVCHGKA